MECKLEFLYQAVRKSGGYVPLHKHECFELVYYIKGSGTTEIGGEAFLFGPNSFTLIPPNVYHDERHDTDTEVLFIGFTSKSMYTSGEAGQYSDDLQHTFLNYLKQMKKEVANRKLHFELKLNLLITELMIDLERMSCSNPKRTMGLTYIRNYLEENFNQNIDINELAQISGYSYHHFRHMFKEKTGMPPNRYIINQRILNARKLLKETCMTMADISQACGFYSESQFSAMFKKSTGMKPSEYRSKYR